jgi:guanyl-specific ribonuclease Sa
MPPAARITDMHVCPIVIPFTPPHVGGPIITGKLNVIVGKMPAARVMDKLICKGPPDMVLKGSPTVIIGKFPAARMMDPTVHGGMIVTGFFPVIIGEFGMGSVITPVAPVVASLRAAAATGAPVVADATPPALGPPAPSSSASLAAAGVPPQSVSRVEQALQDIASGTQRYPRDGITFHNREGRLPPQPQGYYKEYTVPPPPGVRNRGAERLVTGNAGDVYYTPDHYGTFVRIR